jgi:hypothetical protein
MNKLLAVLAFVSVSGSASALDFFRPFYGDYLVKSRYCSVGDFECESLKEVTIGYDEARLASFAIQSYSDGSAVSTLFWEGAVGFESAETTGTWLKTADWGIVSDDGIEYFSEGFNFLRDTYGTKVDLMYSSRSISGGVETKKNRRFILVKKP